MSYLTSFICPLCDRKFFFKATLRLHLERRHTCQICRFTYTDPVELQIHKKSHREGLGQVERPTDFSCILCDRSFENETEVKEHEEQFRCDFCDFTHCKSSEAKKHTKLHGQEDEDFDYHFESVKFEENEAEDDPDEQPLAKRSWKSKKGKKSKKVRTVKTDPVVPHPFPCSFCGELFHDAADHNRHEFECKAAQSNRIKVEPKDPDAALPGEAPSPEPTDTLDLDFDSLSQSSTKSRSGKEYRCPKCNKKFRTKGGCQRHVGRCSEERAPPPDIDLSSLCRINDDGEAEYTCPHCSKVFRTKGGTERHVIQCDGPDRLLYFCPNCDQGFKTRKKLTDHEDHCDGPRETRPLTIDQPSPDERINLEGEKNKEEEEDDPGRNYIKVKKKKLYTCSGCQKTFKNQQYFLRHEDLCLDSGKHHQCRFCDKVFGTDEKLEIHIKTHTCEHCGKQFKNTGQLFTHKKTHDPNAKKFICDICGCEKTAQAHLDKHRNVHFNRRFNCTECDASFKVEENYKEHVHGHSGKPWPYQCTLCDKGFLIKHKLKRHIEKHEAEGKEDNVCNFCGKTFPVLKKYEYRNHLRSHTDPDYKAPEETPVQ